MPYTFDAEDFPEELRPVIDKLRKILNLAERGGTQAEAEAAAAMATELLQKYNLGIADTASDAPLKEAIGEARTGILHNLKGGHYKARKEWVVRLADAVADANYCHVLYGEYSIVFIGADANAHATVFIFNNLFSRLLVMVKIATELHIQDYKRKYGGSPWMVGGPNNPHIYESSWLDGAASGISHKLWEQRRKFQADNPRAIVLVRDEDINLHIQSTRPKLRDFSPLSNSGYNSKAWDAGYNTGRNMDVQKGLPGSTSKELP